MFYFKTEHILRIDTTQISFGTKTCLGQNTLCSWFPIFISLQFPLHFLSTASKRIANRKWIILSCNCPKCVCFHLRMQSIIHTYTALSIFKWHLTKLKKTSNTFVFSSYRAGDLMRLSGLYKIWCWYFP